MMSRETTADPRAAATLARELSDGEIVERIVGGERELFATLMRRYNQQLFRLVRAIVRPDAEAEDALQDAYLNAFTRLGSFEGRASFATWISRIAIRAAVARRERAQRAADLGEETPLRVAAEESTQPEPGEALSSSEVRLTVEHAIDALPEHHRTVVVLRLVEGLSTTETAERLEVTEEVVRIRLLRARERLQRTLMARLEAELPRAFSFDGQRCDRLVAAVVQRLG
jgi:RNA polymerase sigma-70 factor (ECF subfamily)